MFLPLTSCWLGDRNRLWSRIWHHDAARMRGSLSSSGRSSCRCAQRRPDAQEVVNDCSNSEAGACLPGEIGVVIPTPAHRIHSEQCCQYLEVAKKTEEPKVLSVRGPRFLHVTVAPET